MAEAVATLAVSMAAPSPATTTPLANKYLPLTPGEQSLWRLRMTPSIPAVGDKKQKRTRRDRPKNATPQRIQESRCGRPLAHASALTVQKKALVQRLSAD
ncbi:uncharacterized protein PO1_contig-024-70 [Mycobacterium sp. PO1]|nr:uncharacterized protein PO1_contig-024-70 [Mycobacterium sp. PO1]